MMTDDDSSDNDGYWFQMQVIKYEYGRDKLIFCLYTLRSLFHEIIQFISISISQSKLNMNLYEIISHYVSGTRGRGQHIEPGHSRGPHEGQCSASLFVCLILYLIPGLWIASPEIFTSIDHLP